MDMHNPITPTNPSAPQNTEPQALTNQEVTEDAISDILDDSPQETSEPATEEQSEPEELILSTPTEDGNYFNWGQLTSISQFIWDYHNASENVQDFVAQTTGVHERQGALIAKELVTNWNLRYRTRTAIEFRDVFTSGDFMAAARLAVNLEKMYVEDIRSIVRIFNNLNDQFGQETGVSYHYNKNNDTLTVITRLGELANNISAEGWSLLNWLNLTFEYLPYISQDGE